MDISVVIPLFNEEESLKELYDWIASMMQSNQFLYEVIFIDDGSTDTSWEVIEEISQTTSTVKGIRFQKNYGKSQALDAGFQIAAGNVVITMERLLVSGKSVEDMNKKRKLNKEDLDFLFFTEKNKIRF